MNNGAFGENFPYSNFHDLNMDWIIQIAKNFLDQYTSIQQIISDGEENLTNLTETGIANLTDKAEELENLLQAWYNTHSADIAAQLAAALADLDSELATNIQSFNLQAEEKAEETLESIPDDYTALSNLAILNKKNINDIVNIQNISLFRETFTDTGVVTLDADIPEGWYTLHVDSIASTDTDNTVCRVMFLYNDYTVLSMFLPRNTEINEDIAVTGTVNKIKFLASDSDAHSAGDTFTFTGFTVYKNTPIHDKLDFAFNGFSNLLQNREVVAFSNTISATGYIDVPVYIPKGSYVFRSDSITSTDTDNTVCRVMLLRKDLSLVEQFYADRVNNYQNLITINSDVELIRFFASDGTSTSSGDTFTFTNCTISAISEMNENIKIHTSPENLIPYLVKYNGTHVTLVLENTTYDVINMYKAYFGNDYFTNYSGYVGSSNPFDRGLYTTGIKIVGQANTKFIMSADTGNTNVNNLFSVFAPYTDTTLENITIDIGNNLCRYAIHDDFAPRNCEMIYKNLTLIGSGSANALYGMGCGSNALYIFDHCWFISNTTRAFVAHSAPNQTQPCILKLNGCVSHKEIAFYYYSTFSGMNIAYVDANLTNVTLDAVQAGDTENFTIYHDNGTSIDILTQ